MSVYKKHIQQLEIFEETIEIIELAKDGVLQRLEIFEQSCMRERMSTPAGQRDAKIFAHIYYSGDAAIIDDKLEIRLVDG